MKIVNRRKFIKSSTILIISILSFIFMSWLTVDTLTYPEKYLTTWRYQLHNKIEAGDLEAVEYYNTVYIANGIVLWED